MRLTIIFKKAREFMPIPVTASAQSHRAATVNGINRVFRFQFRRQISVVRIEEGDLFVIETVWNLRIVRQRFRWNSMR